MNVCVRVSACGEGETRGGWRVEEVLGSKCLVRLHSLLLLGGDRVKGLNL